jgi:heptosyltransferase-3
MRRGSRKNRILDYWVGIPLLNLLATLRWKRSFPKKLKRIGVLCSPALGDTLLFSGALLDVRKYVDSLPDPVEIIHFCMKTNIAAAELLRGADRRVVIDLTDPLATMKVMRAERLDAMFDFSSWQRLTAFYSMMSGAKFTAGFRTAGMYRSRGYDVTVEHREDRHEVDNFRALLRGLNIPSGSAPTLEIPAADRPEPLSDVKDLVVFHLWASGQRSWLREWPEERWIELAERLARPETIFVITGAPTDLPRSEPFVAKMRAAGLKAQAFVGTDGFKSLARMLMHARVVVSVNTGVMHLAAIVGAPTVSINGPNRNGRWGPAGPRAFGVEAPGDGCGYLHLGFNFDGQATDCMERISVDRVMDAVEFVANSAAEVR